MPASPIDRRDTDPRVVRLPGVGTRLELRDTSGKPVHVVRRNDGRVELHGQGGAPTELDPTNAHTLGAFVTGHFLLSPEVSDRLGDVLGGLVFDWVNLPPGAHAAGRTIEELAVRRRTGVTIVAILRGSLPIVAPDAACTLQSGDDLVIACRWEDREPFARYMLVGA